MYLVTISFLAASAAFFAASAAAVALADMAVLSGLVSFFNRFADQTERI